MTVCYNKQIQLSIICINYNLFPILLYGIEVENVTIVVLNTPNYVQTLS